MPTLINIKKAPKNFPVYISIYNQNNKPCDLSVICKVTKDTNQSLNRITYWGDSPIKIEGVDIERIRDKDTISWEGNIIGNYNTHFTNSFSDTVLVPKDEWIKAIDKANKLIDEENKKQGTKIRRLRY